MQLNNIPEQGLNGAVDFHIDIAVSPVDYRTGRNAAVGNDRISLAVDRGVDHVDASGTAAVIIQRGGSADGQVALDRAAADIERIVIYAGHFERDGIAKDLGHIAFQGATLGNRAAFALDIDVGGGGARWREWCCIRR